MILLLRGCRSGKYIKYLQYIEDSFATCIFSLKGNQFINLIYCQISVVILLFFLFQNMLSLIQKNLKFWSEYYRFSDFLKEITTWKVSKYGVFSSPYFPVFRQNIGKYGPEKLHIWTLFTQWITILQKLSLQFCQKLNVCITFDK